MNAPFFYEKRMKLDLFKQQAPLLTALLLTLLLQCAASYLPLSYDRQAILDGEFWRLITGGWIHHNFWHSLMNMAALVLIWPLLPLPTTAWRSLALLAVLVTGVDLCLLSLPETLYYWGLSGAIHGLFAFAAMCRIPYSAWQGGLWLSALGIKLASDLLRSDSFTSDLIGTRVHVESHLFGSILGMLLAASLILLRTLRFKKTRAR